jgi:FtsH-binding integral membrane protein
MMHENMQSVSSADIDARIGFIRRTYAHLLGAMVAFIGLEAGLFMVGVDDMIAPMMMGSGFSWLIVLGLFMLVGHIANRWAMSDTSVAMQYAGLGLYVVAEAILFLPLLFIAVNYSDPSVIPYAGGTTLVVFAALTVMVFATKKDFSFMRGALTIFGVLAMVAIGASLIFGFSLGLWFSIAMVGLASGYILYYTSNVLHHYRTDQHVAASLALFSAVALLFWYILRIFMARE